MKINFKQLNLLFRKWGKKKKEGSTRELFSGKGMSCACTYFRIGEAKRDDDYSIARCFYVPCEEQRKVDYSLGLLALGKIYSYPSIYWHDVSGFLQDILQTFHWLLKGKVEKCGLGVQAIKRL